MKTRKILSKSPGETKAFGKRLAKCLKPGDILCLFGDLGSGKTTLVKGIAQGLGIGEKEVNSPTFVLMNVYNGRLPLYHFDFYRLDDIQGISSIGYDEFLYGQGVSVIEWADRLGTFLPRESLKVEIRHKELDTRILRLSAEGLRYQKLVNSKW